MDKLAFVKTIEAILAAVVAISVYNFIQTYNVGQVQTFTRSPNDMINDFLNVIDLDSIVNEYDYLKMDSLFNNLFFETIYYYFEPTYYDKIKVKSSAFVENPNVSFIYHFPHGVDENSIRISTGDYELSTQALFNWYKLPLKFNQSITDSYVEINASLSGSNINNDSLMFFIRDKSTPLSVTNWSEGALSSNATVIVYVPEINTSEFAYIYFETNGLTNISYPTLSETKEVNVTQFNVEETDTAEVLFSPSNLTTVFDNYYLKYSLFTSESDSYSSFNSTSNDISVSVKNDDLKGGTVPYTTSVRGDNSVTRLVPLINGFVELRVYGGYS